MTGPILLNFLRRFRLEPDTGSRPNVPMFVDPAADLAPQTGALSDSWFISSNLAAGDHEFGVILHYMNRPFGGGPTLAITDIDGERFITDDAPRGAAQARNGGFEITGDNLRWTGDAHGMRAAGTMTSGRGGVDLTLRNSERLLAYSGTGLHPFIDNSILTYQYAFPQMETTGTLTLDGQTMPVSGNSWFDRQWFTTKKIADMRAISSGAAYWTWMALRLSNGQTIGLWNTMQHREHAWVTILHPDDSLTVAGIEPLSGQQSALWTSDVSHVVWPNQWRVTTPGHGIDLQVDGTFTGQETFSGYPRIETIVGVHGSYQGEDVTGTGFCEIVGDPHAHR